MPLIDDPDTGMQVLKLAAGLVGVAVNWTPAAEVEVSADLVRQLLADQLPGQRLT